MQTEMIMAIFSILLLWISGFALLYLSTGKAAGGLKIIGVALALPLGIVFYSALTILLSLIGVKMQLFFSYCIIEVVDFLFVIFLMTVFILKVRRLRGYDRISGYTGLMRKIRLKITDMINIIRNRRYIVLLSLLAVGLILLGILFFAAIYWARVVPITFWDSISAWSFKAKAFFIDGALDNFFSNYDYSFTHNSYPLAFSLAQSFVAVGAGEFNDAAVKMIFPFIYILFGLAASSALMKEWNLKRTVFVIFMSAFLMSIPIVFDHSYIEYPNMLFALCVVVCTAVTFKFICKPTLENLSLASMATVILPLMRNEGMIFFVLNIIFILVVFFKNRSGIKVKTNVHPSNLTGFALALFFLGSWVAFSLKLGLGVWEWGNGTAAALQVVTTEPMLIFSLKTYFAEMLFSIKNSTGGFLGSGYGVIWILIFLSFTVRFPDILKSRGRLYIFLSALMILLTYVIGGAIVPDFLISSDRYLLPVLGVAYSLFADLLCKLKLTE